MKSQTTCKNSARIAQIEIHLLYLEESFSTAIGIFEYRVTTNDRQIFVSCYQYADILFLYFRYPRN